MKVYARVKQYGKQNKGNIIVATNYKQACEIMNWKNKGWIEKTTYIYAEYIAIKKELKTKGLI